MKSITSKELQDKIKAGEEFHFLDVREQWENYIVRFDESLLIPLGTLSNRYQEIDPDKKWVVYCHHGVRSVHACMFLDSIGFQNIFNLTGGIDNWSQTVDPTVKRY